MLLINTISIIYHIHHLFYCFTKCLLTWFTASPISKMSTPSLYPGRALAIYFIFITPKFKYTSVCQLGLDLFLSTKLVCTLPSIMWVTSLVPCYFICIGYILIAALSRLVSFLTLWTEGLHFFFCACMDVCNFSSDHLWSNTSTPYIVYHLVCQFKVMASVTAIFSECISLFFLFLLHSNRLVVYF